MNKKFFAALTSAAMLLSSTGVVLAADFDEVTTENGSVPGTPVEGNVEINMNTVPDAALRSGLYDEDGNKLVDGDKASDVALIYVNASVKSLEGIEKFTNAKMFVMGKRNPNWPSNMMDVDSYTTVDPANNYISNVDLSANTSLTGVIVANSNAVTSVTLPKDTDLGDNKKLSVVITGNKGLTSLDLSNLPLLENADVSNNDLAELNVAGNPYLSDFNASNNRLYAVDLTGSAKLKTLNVENNKIISLNVPKNIVTLKAANNKLQSFDASALKSATTLDFGQNMLESVVLPTKGALATIDVEGNHLATLNLKNVNFGGATEVHGQTLYYNEDDKAVNVSAYDSAFDTKGNTVVYTYGGTFDDDGVFTFSTGTSTGNDGGVPAAAIAAIKAAGAGYVIETNNGIGKMAVSFKGANLMNRLYNPNSGEHFYTKDTNEKDTLVKLGWQDEGIGWVAPTPNAHPVYRLYNPNAGDHHYTMSANEKDTLARIGWQYEGIGWYSEASNVGEATGNNAIEVFREYNPNAKAAGAHNYTISQVENHALVSLGWMDEGIAWWALK